MRLVSLAVLGLWACVAGTVLAPGAALSQARSAHVEGRGPVVLELYTSQGCSSCPPADRILTDLAKRSDVIALALHVDYWDYIGWKDDFADPDYSERQRDYARAAGARTVYTPQMIVAGRDHLMGTRPAEIERMIRQHAATQIPLSLDLERSGAKLSVAARAPKGLARPLVVQLVRYAPARQVRIERGENAGRTITYSNIVTDWRQVAVWDGRAALRLALDLPGSEPAVVILQEPGPGAIVAAAALR